MPPPSWTSLPSHPVSLSRLYVTCIQGKPDHQATSLSQARLGAGGWLSGHLVVDGTVKGRPPASDAPSARALVLGRAAPCPAVSAWGRGYREQVTAGGHNRWVRLPEGRSICQNVIPHKAPPRCSGPTTAPDDSTEQRGLSRSACAEPGNRLQLPLDIFFRRPSEVQGTAACV